ncbi:MAG: MarR family transcriptional regulator [Acidimicrobiia bacterium]|nr:MarR family transcriptional regulator [Acidimicrobiia bacterium]MDH5422616.1 MarR family transcriptional regulator [Acidimicrobiia bacterium]MDH5503970.1 MarR family transcriptional regulator [Acidimicrobiia bacterium]
MAATTEVQWLTDDEQATWRAFNLASRLVDGALDHQLMRDADMGHTQYAVLVALSEAVDHRARMGDLADLLQYSPSRLSHAVRKMETNGWIERRKCPSDGRGQIAVLTSVGRQTIEQTAPGHVDEVRRVVLSPLTATQQAQLRNICETLLGGNQTT